MSLLVFLLHFLFIGGIFAAGVAVGIFYKDLIIEKINYFVKK